MNGEFTISSEALKTLQRETGLAIPTIRKRIQATLNGAPDILPEIEIGSSDLEPFCRGDLLLNPEGLVDVVSSVLEGQGVTGFGVTLHTNGQSVRVIRDGFLKDFFTSQNKG